VFSRSITVKNNSYFKNQPLTSEEGSSFSLRRKGKFLAGSAGDLGSKDAEIQDIIRSSRILLEI